MYVCVCVCVCAYPPTYIQRAIRKKSVDMPLVRATRKQTVLLALPSALDPTLLRKIETFCFPDTPQKNKTPYGHAMSGGLATATVLCCRMAFSIGCGKALDT